MELQTISQVSKVYGVTTRMLRYYEQIGLIKSLRKEDYSYRVYDEDTLKRLQQIILLRKLQIPVKKICVILNNPKASTVIDVFRENISELEKEISALSTIKSILEKFIHEIEKITAIHLNLDLLEDNSVQRLAESLSLIQKNIKEKISMNELNQAAETLEKTKEKNVRVVFYPPATVAKLSCETDPPNENARAIMEKFVKDVDLFKIKPDFRYFSYGVGAGPRSEFMVTIPDDLEVPKPLVKEAFPGGLWAAYTLFNESPGTQEVEIDWDPIGKWLDNSDNYEGDGRPAHEVYFNPRNIYELRTYDSEFVTLHKSVKAIKRLTAEQTNKLNAALKEVEKLISQRKSTEIDLTAMVKSGNFDLNYAANGLMEIKTQGDKSGMATPQTFTAPLKIELRSKTDSTNIRINFGYGEIIFNWECNRSELRVHDMADYNGYGYSGCGEIPVNEFVDIEWILGKEVMAVKVNGELRHIGDEYGYIEKFKKDPEYTPSSPVTVSGAHCSTVTVESLRVTEI